METGKVKDAAIPQPLGRRGLYPLFPKELSVRLRNRFHTDREGLFGLYLLGARYVPAHSFWSVPLSRVGGFGRVKSWQ